MNKIYSLVWNRARKQIEVASELARGHGGGNAAGAATSVPRARALGSVLALVVAVGAGLISWSGAQAQAYVGYEYGGKDYCVKGGATTFDPACSTWGSAFTSFTGANVAYFSSMNGITQGGVWAGNNNAGLWYGNGPQNTGGTGSRVWVYANNASIQGATVNLLSTNGVNVDSQQIHNLAPGTAATDAVNVSQLQAQETHFYSVNDTNSGDGNYNNDGATGGNALAAGVAAQAIGGNTIAVGSTAVANGDDAIAVGQNATATPNNTIAIGNGAHVDGTTGGFYNSIAIGTGAEAGSGDTAKTNWNSGVAIGYQADARTMTNPSQPGGTNTSPVAIGWQAQAQGNGSQVAIGDRTQASGIDAIAIGGHANSAGATATGDFSTAVGQFAQASADNTLAFGLNAKASQDSALAIGNNANSNVVGGVAIGNNASTNGQVSSVALGVGSVSGAAHTGTTAQQVTLQGQTYNFAGLASAANGTVSVGTGGHERQIQNVAAGDITSSSTDAVNGSQLYATNQALESTVAGSAVHYFSVNGPATPGGNFNNDGALGTGSLAAGVGAVTTAGATNAVAIGNTSTANGVNAIAIGVSNSATGVGSIAIGGSYTYVDGGGATQTVMNVANGANAIALGSGNVASGIDAVFIGINNSAYRGSATSTDYAHNDVVVGINNRAGNNTGAGGSAIFGRDNMGGTTAGFGGVITSEVMLGIGNQTNLEGAGGFPGLGATAVGYKNIADTRSGGVNQPNVAVGALNRAVSGGTGNNAQESALGVHNDARGTNASAVGANNSVYGGNSHAFGSNNQVGTFDTTKDADGYLVSSANAANGTAIGNGNVITGNSSTAVGTGNIVSGANSGAFGDPNTVTGTGSYAFGNDNTIDADNAFVLGNNVTIGTGLDGAVALGNDSVVAASTVASYNPGTDAIVGTAIGSNVVSVGATGAERRITNVAAGGAPSDAVNVSQLQSLSDAMLAGEAHDFSVNSIDPGTDTNYENAGATGNNALAAGVKASAVGANSTAVGVGSIAWNDDSIAIGNGAIAGVSGDATRVATIAIGSGATATAQNSMAIGEDASASGPQATAIGDGAAATAAQSSAFGRSANAGNNGTALGMNATATGTRSTAVGQGAKAASTNGTAIGQFAQATQAGDVALGTGTISSGPDATTNYTSPGAVVNGVTFTVNQAPVNGAVAVGQRQITQVADGEVSTTSTDAINGSQLYNVADTLSNQLTATETHDFSVNSIDPATDTNYDNDGATGNGALAAGVNASATGIGGIAVGNSAKATADAAIAMGSAAVASAYRSISIGQGSRASGNTSVALGSGAQANNANDVALGYASVAKGAQATSSVTVNGVTYNVAGTTPGGTVSLGGNPFSGAGWRTITNVAAGRVSATSTDAVNGSELFATNTAVTALGTTVTNLGTSVASGMGGTSSYDPTTGTLTTSLSIGGANYTDVNSALNAVDATASEGWNLSANGGTGVNIAPGATVDVAQGTNIVVTQDATTGNLTIAMSDTPVFTSVTTGTGANTTVMDGTGITVNGGTNGPVSLTGTGLDNGGNKLTNIADGTDPTDAVNVSQLGTAVAGVKTHYYSVNDGGTQGTNYDNDGATGYNALAAGVDASAAGDNSAAIGYDAAVDGVNSVALGAGAHTLGAGNGGAVALGAGASTSAVQATAIGQGASAANEFAVALGAGSFTAAPNPTASATIGGTVYGFAGINPTSVVSVGNPGNERQITNVAAGQLNANSTDAVNGSQLFATNRAVDAIGTAATAGWNLSANGGTGVNIKPGATVDVAQGTNIVVTQDATTGNLTIATSDTPVFTSVTAGNTVLSTTGVAIGTDVALGATGLTIVGGPSVTTAGIDAGGSKITNVAIGTNPGDAVNLGQLNSVVTGAETHYYSVNGSDQSAGSNYANDGATGADAIAAGVGASASADESTAIGAHAVASNEGDVALGAGSVTAVANPTAGATINGVAYTFAGGNPTSVVSVGSVGNERQITNVAAGQLSATSSDAVNGSQLYATNQAVDTIGTQVNTNTGDIGSLQNQISTINQNGSGMFQVSQDSSGKPMADASGNNSAAGGAGASATGDDALAVGNDSKASGDGGTALGAGAQATGDNSVALGAGSVATGANTVSVGSAGNERQITNVAAGTAPTDAVNVSQLQSAQKGGVHYDSNADGSTNYNSMTLNPGGTGPTVVHNVANGTGNNDAVNVGQMNTAIAGAVSTANTYTDQRYNELKGSLTQIGNRANAGIASAIAAASLPQPYAPNQSSLGVGMGSFRGEAGIAVGMAKISESGRFILKANVSSDTRGDVGAGVGAGIVW